MKRSLFLIMSVCIAVLIPAFAAQARNRCRVVVVQNTPIYDTKGSDAKVLKTLPSGSEVHVWEENFRWKGWMRIMGFIPTGGRSGIQDMGRSIPMYVYAKDGLFSPQLACFSPETSPNPQGRP